jgi:hypothetical protein
VELPLKRSNGFRRGSGLLSDPRANRDMSDLYAAGAERRVKRVGIGAQSSTSNGEIREYLESFRCPYAERPK